MRHLFAALLSLVALAVPTASHAAPTVLFDLADVPTTVTPGSTTHTLRMRYSVSGNSLQNARVAIDLPAGVIPVGAGKDPAFSGGCNFDDPSDPEAANLAQDWRCEWTASDLAVPQGGLSGQIALTVVYRRWGFANGSSVSIAPTFAATWDNNGTASSVGPLTATATTAITSTIDPAIGFRDWSISASQYGYVTLETGAAAVTGILSEILVEVANNGSGPIASGYRLNLNLPAGAVFAGTRRGNGNFTTTANIGATGSISFVSTQALGNATAWPQVDFSNGETYAINYWEGAQHWFYLQVVVPCSALPVQAATGVTVDFRGTAPGIQATETSFATRTYSPGYGLNGVPVDFLCGRPTRSETRSTGSGPQISQAFQAATYLHGPTGAVPVLDAFTSTHYPSPYRIDELSLSFRNLNANDVFEAGFQGWACALPLRSGPITRAEFLSAPVGACTRANFDANRGRMNVPPGTTHLVAFGAPDSPWVNSGEIGDTVWMPLEMRSFGVIDLCMAGATEQNFTISTYAEASDGTTVTTATSSLPLNVPVTHVPGWFNANPPLTATRSQRQLIRFAVAGNGAPLKNPVFALPIPPGVTVLDVRPTSGLDAEGCLPAPLNWRVDNGVLHVTTGTQGAPWYHDLGCHQNGCNQGGRIDFGVEMLFESGHPFINGQIVSFTGSITGENTRPDHPTTSFVTYDVAMQVPGEKRLVLEPVCAEGEGDTLLTGVSTRFENSGGVVVNDVVVEVAVPRTNDGTGTQVDTRLLSAVTTRGTVTCTSNGTVWTSTCDATTTRVRVTAGTLAPYETGTLTMLFEPDPTANVGAIVRHRASMTSSTLLPIETPPGPPARWSLCPGILGINGWFDDGATPGVREVGEVGLGNWVVVLTDAMDPTVSFTVQLPADGRFEFNVGPGTWNVAVQPASASAEAVWSYNPVPPATVTVPSSGRADVEFGATCGCDDNDICTIDSCSFNGQCSYGKNEIDECTAECGNGRVDEGEDCDSEFGIDIANGCLFCSCSPFGFRINDAGACVAICGDGHLLGDETCDDGNSNDGDGCSSNCRIETGWTCERPGIDGCPPSTVCGENRADWCSYADPENPGEASSDWCASLADGRFEGIDFCGLEVECTSFDPSCLANLNSDGMDEEAFYACVQGGLACGLCAAFGPSVCGLDTLLTGGPTTVTEGDPATFTFVNPADPEHETFDCRINGGEWVACDGGTYTWSDLPPGSYTIEIRTCNDDRSVCDDTPATTTFEVVEGQPEPQPEPEPEPGADVGPEPQPEPGPEAMPNPDDGLQASGGASCGGGQWPTALPLLLVLPLLLRRRNRLTGGGTRTH